MNGPTRRQKEILDIIEVFQKRNGFAPTLDEIRRKLHLRSNSTIHQHLVALEQKQLLKKEPNRQRSMEVADVGKMIHVPFLGTISAGEPIEAIQEKESIAVPASKISERDNIFALRVVGESMIEENINDGDVILVRQQSTAENGQKVVALVDGHVRLQPANRTMEPIIIKDKNLTIQGIVVDVIKDTGISLRLPFSTTSAIRKTQSERIEPKANTKNYEIYLGDSLNILPELEQKYTAIYLDPPFNTNRDYKYSAHEIAYGFKDTWKDKEYETWLDGLIKLCKSKLKPNGSLFLHISAELSYIPETVLRKHFKKIEPIFWKKAHGKNTVKNKLGSVVDIIYRATDNGSKFNLIYVPLDEYYFENSYTNKDGRGLYALGSLKHDKTRKGYFYQIKKNGIVYETPYGWKIPKEKMEELMRQNRIHYARPKIGSNRSILYKKLYKHECKGKPLSNLWDDISYITRTTKDGRLYPTQKPLELLKRIIQLSTDKNDWVLDPVAGSGTTGAAALTIGRRTTLVDINPDAIKITKKRLESIQGP